MVEDLDGDLGFGDRGDQGALSYSVIVKIDSQGRIEALRGVRQQAPSLEVGGDMVVEGTPVALARLGQQPAAHDGDPLPLELMLQPGLLRQLERLEGLLVRRALQLHGQRVRS